MRHVLGLAIDGLGVSAALARDLGPVWYTVAVAVRGPVCTILGGYLNKERNA